MEPRDHSTVSVLGIGLPTAAVVVFLLTLFSAVIIVNPCLAHAQTFTVLANFAQTGNVGYAPYSGFVTDQAGRFYGTNSMGGTHGYGTVYRIAPAGSGWIATGLYSFQGGTDGATPYSPVAFGPDGTLYGATSAGGTGGYGTVYNLRPPATVCKTALCPWEETVLYRFTGGSDGATPQLGALAFDEAGNLYGTTYGGGANGVGVVFKLTRSGNSWTESVLWSFTGHLDGAFPISGVIFDNAGNLYGTTSDAGGDGYGVVYELSPSGSGWTQKTLYSFTDGDGGGSPYGGVIMDAQGNLWGTTCGCIAGGGGEAYELTSSHGNWTLSMAQYFNAMIGPYDTLTIDGAGNLYGTIFQGGIGGSGQVFKLIPTINGLVYVDIYDFSFGSGFGPAGGVVLDAAGNLYGTTAFGGQNNKGLAWKVTPAP